ncbi:YlxR family protein [Salicibibacter halophilus]|uniref:YlxR family protein n=1 Tax=Salicibibacter halophilus TaxID=2502791 RepID=A0A514LEI0_9BACI|nr:YlxR family protein [Salicibibacter halophilus]QDI90266.1 YlxR family protein [Salicibibacter halophilus]
MKKRKTPLRKCIVTGEMKAKKELVRIVRGTDGHVSVDPTGKKNGRGSYITNTEECFALAKKKDLLSRHLKVNIDEESYERLETERLQTNK